MRFIPKIGTNIGTILTLFFLGLITFLLVIPSFFVSEAVKKQGGGLLERTSSHDDGSQNYDIRTDKQVAGKLTAIRESQAGSNGSVKGLREEMAHGETTLRSRVPDLKIEYNAATGVPEVIAQEAMLGRESLSPPTAGNRVDTLKNFLRENGSLIGLRNDLVEDLKTTEDYSNPDGRLSFVELKQEINGIPVFAGEVKAGFTDKGDLVRVINSLAPGIDASTVSDYFGDASNAVAAASANIGRDVSESDVRSKGISENERTVKFGNGDWDTKAEKIYFPVEPGVAVPAWSVLIWEPVNAYYFIVDANSGTVLWRKNITEDQKKKFTFSVYANSNAMVNVAENPAPLTPGPISPVPGTQGSLISRSSILADGNESPYEFNSLGWVFPGLNVTDGNAVEAGPDRDCQINTSTGQCQVIVILGESIPIPKDGVDAPVSGSGYKNFTFNYDPAPGNPAPGDNPLPAGASPTVCTASPAPLSDFQKGAVAQLFYITNRYHDEMYRLGFTETAGNFQDSNFNRGGLGGDRISAQAQDCSGANNANFSTPPDGTRPRMQMYLFTAPNPDRDGSLDADVVIHELTHGLSNRLHGNANGLSSNMSRGMGEGWSDFYALAMLSEPTDPIEGIYASGGYVTYDPSAPGNYYYGIRRFPKAVMSFKGGPNNRPHNPLTFADIDATKINLSDGAFPPAFTGVSADQVHAAGEIWSSALWEVRAKFVQRLGWAVGNRRVLQLVTDGMKLAPAAPTFLQERDAILAAALASGTDLDVRDIWAGFAIRGMGASAAVLNPGNGNGTARVTEAFDLPNLLQEPKITISDPAGNNNGYAEPGESIQVTVPLKNLTGIQATNVTAQIVGGGSAVYGSIAHTASASKILDLVVPPGTACGSALNITINVDSSLGPKSFTRTIVVGVPANILSENFDSAAAPAFANGWTATPISGGVNFVTSANGPDSAPLSAFALDPTTIGGGTDLVSPPIQITASAATVSFRNKYNTEPDWDGGVLEISIGGGSFTDIVTAGGRFLENGYNTVLGTGSVNNPLVGRSAWSGNSNGYVTTTAILPPSANGQTVRLRWRFGSDDNITGTGTNPGWYVDGITITGSYSCAASGLSKVRGDFDGDFKTDISAFRPSTNTWWINGSTSGIVAYNWGLDGDILVPADYDHDGKTDVATYHPGSPSTFWILNSNGNTVSEINWGLAGDTPVVNDYDGDSIPDIAVYRPSDGTWYIRKSTGGTSAVQHGQSGDIPVVGDFDGDGIGDLTVYRSGEWITQRSTGGTTTTVWGTANDKPIPADYDGDGKDDIAAFLPLTGDWYIINSSTGNVSYRRWGVSTDIPIPGDYDGDGKYDIAVYRPSTGEWWILRSSDGGIKYEVWGISTDIPIPANYLPR